MKVQLQGQSLRLRLDEAELAQLQAGQAVVSHTQLLPGAAFSLQVQVTAEAKPALLMLAGQACFQLPQALLAPYVARLPCRDGLSFSLPVGDSDTLLLVFEVDVRDSVRSRGAARR